MKKTLWVLLSMLVATSFGASAATVKIYNSTSNVGSIAETIWIKAKNRTSKVWEQKAVGDWTWTRLSVNGSPIVIDPEKYSDVEVVGFAGTQNLIIPNLDENENNSYYIETELVNTNDGSLLQGLCSNEDSTASNVSYACGSD